MVFLKLGHCLVELEAFGGKSNLVEFGDFRADEISGAKKRGKASMLLLWQGSDTFA